MQFKPNRATLYVGGGITEASNAEPNGKKLLIKHKLLPAFFKLLALL